MTEIEGIVLGYVGECARREEAPRAGELATHLEVDVSTLRRRCIRQTGRTTKDLIRKAQVDIAAGLIASGRYTTAEAAYRSGFGSRRTLFRVFHDVTGSTPTDAGSHSAAD